MPKMNIQPDWCPHKDCKTLRCIDNAVCSGRMPHEVPHDIGVNTHRFCLHNEDGVIDLQVHSGDAFCFKMVLDAITADNNQRRITK